MVCEGATVSLSAADDADTLDPDGKLIVADTEPDVEPETGGGVTLALSIARQRESITMAY